MDTPSLLSEGANKRAIALEDGWYLLRRSVLLSNRIYRAGTLVEYRSGAWFLRDSSHGEKNISLTPEMVCRTFYHGVSLYQLECTGRGVIFARPVLSEQQSERVDPMLVHLAIQSGEGRVCVKFGHCFLPLELFKW